MVSGRRPRVGVWKFSSCDGCQLTLLDCEDELLEVAGAVEFAHFVEAGPTDGGVGPFDLSLVEGSVTTPEEAERIRLVRERSRYLVTIGACATTGGIQALRNFADVEEYLAVVYAHPEFVSTLATSTGIAEHVPVDFELRGCPIRSEQLLEVVSAYLAGRSPEVPSHSVCVECKRAGNICVTVAAGTPCLGPLTHAGCGALCPTYTRGCYGCFGPSESSSPPALVDRLRADGWDDRRIGLALRSFTGWAEPFRSAGEVFLPSPRRRSPALPATPGDRP